jgi:ubiquinone/menaquinone biosynthesis C-methylase UbiE
MSVDRYAGAAPRWATGAALVYGPISQQIVAMSPHRLTDRVVLDAGAGTGLASSALAAQGARIVAADVSHDMLVWDAGARPPAVVADIRALPFATNAVDDSVAAFVLNHLVEPATAFAELIRVTRPGGAVLAGVFGSTSSSEARDLVDDTARDEGWQVPGWYLELKAKATPILGAAEEMSRAATAAGLVAVHVDEHAVDVGISEPEQLVDYRLGQAHFASWLTQIDTQRAEEVRRHAIEAVRPIMCRYRPIVVFLAATIPEA